MKYSVAVAPWALENAPILYRDENWKNLVDLSRKAGYDAVELNIRDPGTIDGDAFQAYCAENGMEVSAIGTGMACVIDHLSLTDDSVSVRGEAVSRMKEFIRLGEKLDSAVVIGSLRGRIPDPGRREQSLGYFSRALDELLEEAEKRDVTILLEVINRYENNFFNTAEETVRFVREKHSGHLMVHLDTFHMNIEEADSAQSVRLCGKDLGYIHIADNTRRYAGSGSLDFSKVICAAREIGYDGYLSLECLPLPDADTAARRSAAYLDGLGAR